MKFDDGGGVTLVVFRPAIEDAGTFARHLAKARLEAVKRLLRLSKLTQGEIDLLNLNLQSDARGVSAIARDDTTNRSRAQEFACRSLFVHNGEARTLK